VKIDLRFTPLVFPVTSSGYLNSYSYIHCMLKRACYGVNGLI
jgi:hypothetical protein